MKNKKVLILSLNPGYDQWHIVRKEPSERNVFRSDEVYRIISGKGLNVARVLHNLKYENYKCINIVGGKIGEIISERSEAEGLRCINFYVDDESRINTCVMLEFAEKILSYNEPGPVFSKEETAAFKKEFKTYIQGDEKLSIVISGAPCRGISEVDFKMLLSESIRCGHELIIDVSGNWLKLASQFPIKIMKVNRAEFQEAFDIDAFLYHEKLKRFKIKHGICNLIVTDGKNGSLTCCEDNTFIYSVTKHAVGGLHTVGSGDSFMGGLLVKYGRNMPFIDCIRFAGACGLCNTYQHGPAMIEKKEIEKLIPYITCRKQ